MKKLFFIISINLLSLTILSAQNKNDSDLNTALKTIFSSSSNCVNDFEKVLTPEQAQTLNNTLNAFEKKYLYKIVIVTTPTVKPFASFEEFAQDLDQFLAKDPRLDPTILIVVSKTLRQIQVLSIDFIRYKLNNEDTQSIVSTYAVPEFKKGDYFKGLEQASEYFMKKLQPN